MTAEPLVVKIRGGGDALIGKLAGGLTFTQIGNTITGGGSDAGRAPQIYAHGFVHRFRGQLWVITFEGTGGARLKWSPFDAGGSNDWYANDVAVTTDAYPRHTVMGGFGSRIVQGEGGGITNSPMFTIVTENRDYLVFIMVRGFTDDPSFHTFDPGTLAEFSDGTVSRTEPVANHGSSTRSYQAFAFNGLLYAAYGLDSTAGYWSFDPVTKATVQLNRAFNATVEHHYFFSIWDRLFIGVLDGAAGPYGNSGVAELVSGAWVDAGLLTRIGCSTERTRVAVFQIGIGKVLVFAFGFDLATATVAGFSCRLFSTAGDSPTGALQITDVTAAVVTASGFSFPGGENQGAFGYTSISDPLGTKRHYMYWCSSTTGPSAFTLYEVFDEVTPLAKIGDTNINSDYAPPYSYYSGGEVENGIDQSTRLITVGPRGWAQGPTGAIIKCGAYGDPMVLAHPAIAAGKTLFHGAVTGGPFQVGETVTGGSSGATGTVTGIGTEGMHITSITGTFIGGETLTGGTSSATAVLSIYCVGSPASYINGETLSGGTSLATATIATQPDNSFTNYLKARHGIVQVSGTSGTFQDGEAITGGTSAFARTMDPIQDAAFIRGETLTGLTSGATATIIGDGAAEGLHIRQVTGTFQAGETVEGSVTGTRTTLNTVLQHGSVTGGSFQVGEVVTGGTSGATGTVTHLGIGGTGNKLVKVDTVTGTFLNGEVITGGTSGATAGLIAGPVGYHGGAADKTIRVKYFHSATGPTGKGVPISGYCTLVDGSGVNCTVSKGTGPGGSDELINVVAENCVGEDDHIEAEWNFLADGVPEFLISNIAFEIDRI